jgi:hypothetical protein
VEGVSLRVFRNSRPINRLRPAVFGSTVGGGVGSHRPAGRDLPDPFGLVGGAGVKRAGVAPPPSACTDDDDAT